MTCIICTGVENSVTAVQRKKKLGLLAASHQGHKNCADIFIREGADVNGTDRMFDVFSHRVASETGILFVGGMQKTPLMYAAGNDHLGIVKKLIKAGADVNLVIKQTTVLQIAASNGHFKCVKSLIKAGANVNVTDPSVTPPLLCAIRTGDSENKRKIIELLIEAGADVNSNFCDTVGMRIALMEAVRHGTPQILSMLTDAGSFQSTPLFAAAYYGKVEFIKPLIEAGADVNQQNADGKTPLHGTLIADSTGVTPLMLAAKFCFHVRDMIWGGHRKGDVVARKNGCINRICRLLKAGAEIGRRDHLGRNSVQVSFQPVQKEVKEIQRLLYAAGETLDGPTVNADDVIYGGVNVTNIPKYFTELKENVDLKHLCREAIRKHLIDLDPHKHLFGRIPQLGLPLLVTEYLLYDCTLDPKEIICNDSDEIMDFP